MDILFASQYTVLLFLLSIARCYAAEKIRDERIHELVQLFPFFNQQEGRQRYRESSFEEFSRALETNTRVFQIFLKQKEVGNYDLAIPQSRLGCLTIRNWTELCARMSMFVSKNDPNDIVIQAAPFLMHVHKENIRREAELQEKLYTRVLTAVLIPPSNKDYKKRKRKKREAVEPVDEESNDERQLATKIRKTEDFINSLFD